jgi:hypothetical protein
MRKKGVLVDDGRTLRDFLEQAGEGGGGGGCGASSGAVFSSSSTPQGADTGGTSDTAAAAAAPSTSSPHNNLPARTAYIETYGCQMNVSDSEIVAAVLQAANYVVTDDLYSADAILINTCAIRDGAEVGGCTRGAEHK